jgi:hypothetical protein
MLSNTSSSEGHICSLSDLYYLSTVKGTVIISWYGERGDCCSGDDWQEIILRETGYYLIKDGMKMGLNPNSDSD